MKEELDGSLLPKIKILFYFFRVFPSSCCLFDAIEMGKQIRRPRSERKRIAEEAKENGLKATSNKYGISTKLITSWQSRLIGEHSTRPMSSFSQGQMLEIIEEAAEYGSRITANKYNITPEIIRCWKWRLYKRLVRIRPEITPHSPENPDDAVEVDEDLVNAINSCYDDFKNGDIAMEPLLLEFLEDAKQKQMHLGSHSHASRLRIMMGEAGMEI